MKTQNTFLHMSKSEKKEVIKHKRTAVVMDSTVATKFSQKFSETTDMIFP